MTEKKKRKPRNYINNKTFYEEIKKYIVLYNSFLRGELEEKPIANRYIALSINQICNNLSSHPRFSGYTFRSEMVSDGILHCVNGLHKFNPEKTDNPFAYFTQVAKNAFWQRINSERKENYIKYKNFSNQYLFCGEGEYEIMISDFNEATNEIIDSFEEEMKTKREISKQTQTKNRGNKSKNSSNLFSEKM